MREQVLVDGGPSFRVTGAGFWQVHPGAADACVGAVLDALAPRPGERALDLYCGVGLFAAALAAARRCRAARCWRVEGDARAVADARRNLHDLPWVRLQPPGGSTARWAPGAARRAPTSWCSTRRGPGPGRRWCEAVAALRPRAVAYVACDPAALARDVATSATAGYRLAGLRAFDLFPMTHHVECVAMLVPA